MSSRDEVGDEVFDSQRLLDVKELLWRAVKRTNENGVRADDFVQILKDLKALAKPNH